MKTSKVGWNEAPQWRRKLAKEILSRRPPKNFERRSVYAKEPFETLTMDLVDMKKYANVNSGRKWILVVLDIFSRFAFARGLLNKSAISTCDALEEIIKEIRTKHVNVKRIWCDEGKEFYNVKVVDMLQRNGGITLYSTLNDGKACVAERFIRSLRRMLNEHWIVNDSTVWYTQGVLQDIITRYNDRKHRTLGMTPRQAIESRNISTVYKRLNTRVGNVESRIPFFRVGQRVRLSKKTGLFHKESYGQWSEEIFEITTIYETLPVTYGLKDLLGEEISGKFYKQQLKVTNQKIYRIEKVVRRRNRGTESLIKWFGYGDKHNVWMKTEELKKSLV